MNNINTSTLALSVALEIVLWSNKMSVQTGENGREIESSEDRNYYFHYLKDTLGRITRTITIKKSDGVIQVGSGYREMKNKRPIDTAEMDSIMTKWLTD